MLYEVITGGTAGRVVLRIEVEHQPLTTGARKLKCCAAGRWKREVLDGLAQHAGGFVQKPSEQCAATLSLNTKSKASYNFV